MSPFLFNSIPVRDCACTHRPLRLWEYLISIFLLTSRIWVDRLRVPLVFRLQDFLFYYQCVTFHSTLEQELAATPAATRQLHKLIYIYNWCYLKTICPLSSQWPLRDPWQRTYRYTGGKSNMAPDPWSSALYLSLWSFCSQPARCPLFDLFASIIFIFTHIYNIYNILIQYLCISGMY